MTAKTAEEQVVQLLIDRKETVAVAESCTGGLLGHLLTNVPGSSAFFSGGFLTYSYEAKELLLQVDHQTLITYGAVSEEVAVQMAANARRLLQTDYALSITGIAGPGGGMPGKPVGLTYVGLSDAAGTSWRRFVWDGDRAANKEASAQAALSWLLEVLHEREKNTREENDKPPISG